MKKLTPEQLVWSGQVSWEATYNDGTVYREKEGGKYHLIERNQLKSFRIVSPGETLIELHVGDGRSGRNLCYRRRTGINQGGGKVTWFVVGWAPMGPAFAVDVANQEIYQAPGFVDGDIIVYPPQPIPEAGETFTFSSKMHALDAKLAPEFVTLPSGYVMKVAK